MPIENRNEERFEEIAELIENEIKFSTGRGMQYDYSFHHRHDDVNNTLSYGLQYANVFAEWAAYVAGTRYAFSGEQLEHLIDYYLDGVCKMMVYGKYPDLGAKNRSISREGTLSPRGTESLQKLLKTSDYRNSELRKIIKVRQGEAESFQSYTNG